MLSSLMVFGMLTMAAPAPSGTVHVASTPAVQSGYGCADGSKPWVPGAIRTKEAPPPEDRATSGPQYNPAVVKADCAVV